MIKVLESSMFMYQNNLVVNPELLDDSDFTELFNHKTVYIYDKNRDNTDYIINKVIHDILSMTDLSIYNVHLSKILVIVEVALKNK